MQQRLAVHIARASAKADGKPYYTGNSCNSSFGSCVVWCMACCKYVVFARQSALLMKLVSDARQLVEFCTWIHSVHSLSLEVCLVLYCVDINLHALHWQHYLETSRQAHCDQH